MQIDPRTVARDIPGMLDEVFPQITPGIVAHFNSQAYEIDILQLPSTLLNQSRLQRAMLFELGYTVAERLMTGSTYDWTECVAATLQRQRAFFDATPPGTIEPTDKRLAEIVAHNLTTRLRTVAKHKNHPITLRPSIPGLEWIGTGQGDFSVGHTLIEVKCTAKRFSAADYRQVAIYWLLSFAAAAEGKGDEWQDFSLLNPRSGEEVSMSFDSFLKTISSGRTKVEILQVFQALVGSRLTR